MLRITVKENSEAVVLKLEGRLTGPWVEELGHLWEQTAPGLNERKLSLDLLSVAPRDFSYLDSS